VPRGADAMDGPSQGRARAACPSADASTPRARIDRGGSMAAVARSRIDSPKNPRVKELLRLHERRAREREGRTLVEGTRETLRAAEAGVRIDTLLVAPDLLRPDGRALAQRLERVGVAVVELAEPARRRAGRARLRPPQPAAGTRRRPGRRAAATTAPRRAGPPRRRPRPGRDRHREAGQPGSARTQRGRRLGGRADRGRGRGHRPLEPGGDPRQHGCGVLGPDRHGPRDGGT